MRILASLILFVFLCCGAHAADAGDHLVLKTGGDIYLPAFTVWLSASGNLAVSRTKTIYAEAGRFERDLKHAERDHLLALASGAHDFDIGCNGTAGGTSVGMRVTYKGAEHIFSCQHAPSWPVGEATTKFMDTLNAILPNDMQVY